MGGGGKGLSLMICAGVMFQAFTFPKLGSMHGRTGMSRLIQGISPRAIAPSANASHCVLLPTALAMPSVLNRPVPGAEIKVATALPKASPAEISLAVAFPDHRAALRWSPARNVISSTAAGNNNFSISAVTPEITASSEG